MTGLEWGAWLWGMLLGGFFGGCIGYIIAWHEYKNTRFSKKEKE